MPSQVPQAKARPTATAPTEGREEGPPSSWFMGIPKGAMHLYELKHKGLQSITVEIGYISDWSTPWAP